jgi:hypothetical protein
MKCIVVIKGVTVEDYQRIRMDLVQQMETRGMIIPLFALLPADYSDIEIIWLDEEMEKDLFAKSLHEVIKK